MVRIKKAGTNPNSDLVVNSITVGQGSQTEPSLAIGDGDSGFYEGADDLVYVTIGGVVKFFWQGNTYGGQGPSAGAIQNISATATVPTLNPNRGDQDTGIGSAGADQLSLIVGGVEGLRLIENGGVLQLAQLTAGITADTGSSQGDGPLTSSNNEISVCANAGDAVTLPSAVAGYEVFIINNGANACDVFPASGDNAGGGVDTAVSLAAGANITYFAYDTTNWATKV